MSALVNRVPTGRIISLHTELKYLYWKFKNRRFSLQGMKLDPSSEKTQLDFFPLAVYNPKYGKYKGKYDPYLDNPLDKAGFHLTQSIERDSQKSKSVSECFNALEGLGWISRLENHRGKISVLGQKVAELNYSDKKFLALLKNSLLNYGPFVGFLFECIKKSNNGEVRRADIVIGYVDTGETVKVNGQSVPLSVGSQDDSIIRTRSTLVAWAMTAGYIWPVNEKIPNDVTVFHVNALELIKQKSWPWSKFKILLPTDFFTSNKITVSHPLSYKWMTKSTKALRERGQSLIRGTTLIMEERIKNRRFAVVYALAFTASKTKKINFAILLHQMKKYPDLFVVDGKSFYQTMKLELNMAITAGMIFSKEKGNLVPIVKGNLEYLSLGAPSNLLVMVKKIIKYAIKL